MYRQTITTLLLLAILFSASPLFAEPGVGFVRTFQRQGSARFNDIYATEDGGYVMCGRCGPHNSSAQSYVVRVNETGEELWTLVFDVQNLDYMNTIVELDNGDFALAGVGTDAGSVIVGRISDEGESLWLRSYDRGIGNALIELKNGDLVLAGQIRGGNGFLLRIDATDGDVVWQIEDEDHFYSNFLSLLESEEYLIAAGVATISVRDDSKVLWGKFSQQDGEAFEMMLYDPPVPPDQNSSDAAMDMSSHPDGYVLHCVHNWSDNGGLKRMGRTILVDRDGGVNWDVVRDPEDDGIATYWFGGCLLEGGDIVQVGYAGNDENNTICFIWNWLGSGGDEYFHQILQASDIGDFTDRGSYFYSVVSDRNGGAIACGTVVGAMDRSSYGVIVQLTGLENGPRIYFSAPEDSILYCLRNDTLVFECRARDPFEREIEYLWLRNSADTLDSPDDTIAYIPFPETGVDTIECIVRVEDFTDSVRWLVDVSDLYIQSVAPDSNRFTVRRGNSLDFALNVRASEPDSVTYRWTLDDAVNGAIEIGDSASVVRRFNVSGDYELEALATLWEEQESMTWQFSVRGAIWRYEPVAETIELTEGEEQLFQVWPFDIEADSVDFLWTVNGDTVGFGSSEVRRFDDAGDCEVWAYVRDGEERDSVMWTVTVRPEGVGSFQFPVSSFQLDEVYPNPFNARTVISYQLPVSSFAKLGVYDLSGRLVEELVTGTEAFAPGRHSVTWDAAGVAAGVYLIRLEAISQAGTPMLPIVKKAVLIK